jgi:hypothetical protein
VEDARAPALPTKDVSFVAVDDSDAIADDQTQPTVPNPVAEPKHSITQIRGRVHGILLTDLLLDGGANINLIDLKFLRHHYRPYPNPVAAQGVGGLALMLGEVWLTLSLGNDYTYCRLVKFKVVDNLTWEALIGTPVINLFKIDQLTSEGICRFCDTSQSPHKIFETPLKTYENDVPPLPPPFRQGIPIRSSAAFVVDPFNPSHAP